MIKTWTSRSMSVKAPVFYEQLEYVKLSIANFQTKNRKGEVAMVLRCGDSVWMLRKDHYESSLYRIPTGGIHHEETPTQALERELFEETGAQNKFQTDFLGTIVYQVSLPEGSVNFASYIFLIDFGDKMPVPTDPKEKITGFKLIQMTEIKEIADTWSNQGNLKKKPYWSEWCQFRSILHYKVAELLAA